MRVNVDAPTLRDLVHALDQLRWQRAKVRVEDLALWCRWARFDMRVAEVLVQFFVDNFSSLQPVQLGRANLSMDFPQCMAVLMDFAETLLPRNSRKIFRAWKKTVIVGVQPAPFQNFFFGMTFKPERLLAEIDRSPKPYRRWGFYSDANLAKQKNAPAKATTIPKRQRQAFLRALFADHPSITVAQYIQALDGQIHPRQAERDLQSFPNVVASGFTRNRRYSQIED
jgi:hypothetical protein